MVNFPLIESEQVYVPYISQVITYGMKDIPSFYCTVSVLDPTSYLSLNVFQGKIKRVRGFYTDDFKYLKSLLPAEVCLTRLASQGLLIPRRT